MSKKWLNATFLSFTGFASRIRSRAAKPARYENLKVFIRSDVHDVRAGIKLKGQPPLNNPRVFDTLGPLLCSGLSLSKKSGYGWAFSHLYGTIRMGDERCLNEENWTVES